MSIITNSNLDNPQVVNIYEWSIREVMAKREMFKRIFLIGYIPNQRLYQITCINQINLKQVIVSGKHSNILYLLRGQSGLNSINEAFWNVHIKTNEVIYEKDISHKYRNLEDEQDQNN